jgi:hypothetical protein
MSINVGRAGGDLPARRFALLMTIVLTVLPLPSLQVSSSTLKLVSLAVAMSGTVLLIAGLVFLQKTHYAGIMLIPSACAILATTQVGGRLGASLIGFGFSAAIAWHSLTGRCPVNRFLGIDSHDREAARETERS